MTDGTSQGLFIVVAIVIFGIFVVMAYILFEDTLSPALASMFIDATEQAHQRLNDSPLNVKKIKNMDGSVTLTATSIGVDGETIELLSLHSGINYFPNGNFTESISSAQSKYGVIWNSRYVTGGVMRDTENRIDGNPTLKMQFDEPGFSVPNVGVKDISTYFKNFTSYDVPFTFSFNAYSNKVLDFKIRLGQIGPDAHKVETVTLTPEVNRYSVSFNRSGIQEDGNMLMWTEVGDATIWINGLQVEYGEDESDYTEYSIQDGKNGTSGKSLEMNIENPGVYVFKLVDSEGKVYEQNITVTQADLK